jgi:signal transduction histidine kinase
MEIVIGLVAVVVATLVGVAIGRSAGAATGHRASVEQTERELGQVLDQVSSGRLPTGAAGSFASDLRSALQRGWAPRQTERRAALAEAIERVAGFLDRNVRTPLAGARPAAPADELRERIDQALGALEDVDFFLTEGGSAETRGTDLVSLAQKLSREFASDQGVGVRLHLGAPTLRATVAPEPLKDALYLVLHNAARFGAGGTIDMTVVEEDGKAHIRVRDRGEGFTPEAFERAFDPFYSTTPDGLGLGLPHARKSIEAMGGHIELRNVPDGGAEVEVTLPRG